MTTILTHIKGTVLFRGHRTALIIPALDEADAIGPVVAAVDRSVVDDLIVVDNGSRDDTIAQARASGATVFQADRRGYGSACQVGIWAAVSAELLVFLDGDGSDDVREIPKVLAALLDADADLVIGSRVTGGAEPGALTPVQRFGNALTCHLVTALWGAKFTDLGPFRAIRRDALAQLQMADPDFGWTIEMQVKAVQRRLSVIEVPVHRYIRQAGASKVSGTVLGSMRAGKRILGYVLRAKLGEVSRGFSGGGM